MEILHESVDCDKAGPQFVWKMERKYNKTLI